MIKNIIISMFIFIILANTSYAANLCSGKISGVSIAGNGGVFATINNNTDTKLQDVLFCNLEKTVGRYNTKACNGVLSALLMGQVMNKTGVLWFSNAGSFKGCNHRWAQLHKFGFYHFKVN